MKLSVEQRDYMLNLRMWGNVMYVKDRAFSSTAVFDSCLIETILNTASLRMIMR